MINVLVAVASVKGSPGVTTFALGLAARWPAPGPVMVEADPAGGDLAMRFGHYPEPGLAVLATAARRRSTLATAVQRLALGVDVVLAPPGPQAGDMVAMLVGEGLPVLQHSAGDRVVVADIGRLDAASPALGLLAVADTVVVVSWASVDAVAAVDARMPALAEAAGGYQRLRLVLVGDTVRAGGPVLTGPARAVPLLVGVPHDRRGAKVLTGRARPGRAWTRLPLPRAARAAALELANGRRPPPANPLPGGCGQPPRRARRPDDDADRCTGREQS